jgi:glyoxylase-like metal-dependent hydrolase (beta-lactamase superfamily II)
MDHRTAGVLTRGHLACHCVLVEAGEELVLVDTGFGLRDVASPRSRLSPFFLGLVAPELREEMTAIRQIERLGLDPRDVRHIVLTHLDFDHAGGLDDFPWARVHLLELERQHAFERKTWLDRQRFRPEQWSTRDNWHVYRADRGETWLGLDGVQRLSGLPPELLIVPLIGHTFGHAGVAIRCRPEWLLLAGDAYFFHAEMDPDRPWCTPGLRFYQTMMEKDRKARLANQRRLRELRRARSKEVDIFCSHDLVELERLSEQGARSGISTPAPRWSPSAAGHSRQEPRGA